MEPEEYDIEFPRGDTCPLRFELIDNEGNKIELKDEDELYFTMKKGYGVSEYILQKKFSNAEIKQSDGVCSLVLLPDDTNKLKYGTYVYDLCIKSGDFTKTLCLGQITLTNEATFVNNE